MMEQALPSLPFPPSFFIQSPLLSRLSLDPAFPHLESYKAMSEMMTTNMLVKIKEAPPYITREWQGLGVRVTIK